MLILCFILSHLKNDRCEDATDLGSFDDGQTLIIMEQSNIGATDDVVVSPDCAGTRPNGVWYKLSIAFPAEVQVSTCNQADFDTRVEVYKGPCGALSCKDSFDNTNACDGTFYFLDGEYSQNIYILVGGSSSKITGTFALAVTVVATPPVSTV